MGQHIQIFLPVLQLKYRTDFCFAWCLFGYNVDSIFQQNSYLKYKVLINSTIATTVCSICKTNREGRKIVHMAQMFLENSFIIVMIEDGQRYGQPVVYIMRLEI